MIPSNEREELIERQAQFTSLEKVSDWLARTQRQLDSRVAAYRRLVAMLFATSFAGIAAVAVFSFFAFKHSQDALSKAREELRTAQRDLEQLYNDRAAQASVALKELYKAKEMSLQQLAEESIRLRREQSDSMDGMAATMTQKVEDRAASLLADSEKALQNPDGPVFKAFRDALLADADLKMKLDSLAKANDDLQRRLADLSRTQAAQTDTFTRSLQMIQSEIAAANDSLTAERLVRAVVRGLEVADPELQERLFKAIQRGMPGPSKSPKPGGGEPSDRGGTSDTVTPERQQDPSRKQPSATKNGPGPRQN